MVHQGCRPRQALAALPWRRSLVAQVVHLGAQVAQGGFQALRSTCEFAATRAKIGMQVRQVGLGRSDRV